MTNIIRSIVNCYTEVQGQRERSPATKNYVPEIFQFGILAGVNHSDVQWNSLVLEEPPR